MHTTQEDSFKICSKTRKATSHKEWYVYNTAILTYIAHIEHESIHIYEKHSADGASVAADIVD
jgi:hypothetical protein